MFKRGFFAGLQLFVPLMGVALVSGCAKNTSDREEVPGENRVTVASCAQGAKVGPFQAICPTGNTGIQSINSAAAKIFLSSVYADPSKNFTAPVSNGSDPAPGGTPAPQPSPAPSTAPTPVDHSPGSLTLGYPIGLLGEQNIFGGVITKVSDQKSEKFGGLKLTDLTGIHVKTLLTKVGNQPALALVGCPDKCTETSKQELLVTIPIVGIDQENDLLAVDLASLGKQLDLVSMLDPNGEYTGLQAVESKTTALDFGLSTLVFDIETRFVPKTPAAEPGGPVPTGPETKFTVRWYLKLSSGFSPSFVSRAPVPAVGFFETERAAEKKITRFAFTDYGQAKGVHYYVKNVPDRWRGAFKNAFDSWNAKLEPILGRKLLTYEFVDANDPRNDALVPGDIRYNIIEWDLVNKASYGGLGPSIANQFTGETFSANILIQGPTIMELYTDWYKTVTEAQRLRRDGREAEAQMALLELSLRAAQKDAEAKAMPKFSLKLRNLAFRVTSQMPGYEDPIADQRNDYDDVPDGVDFDTYMNGYFLDMVAHEMGHNLGLRHNFRGNLASDDSGRPGTVSRSVMEYLGRRFRYLDGIGAYDIMAISFGYTGRLPDHDGWFCTDENKIDPKKAADNSAECSSDDATSDPFSWLEERLARSIDKIVARGSQDAPIWDLSNLARELGVAVAGLNSYASSAEKTSSGWTNFFGKPGRPANASGVKAYVLAKIKAQTCDPNLEFVIRQKRNADAQAKTRANLEAFRVKVAELSKPWGAFTADDLKCQ